jgi:TrmH family RNA methyltransferase
MYKTPMEITSPHNPKYRRWLSLLEAKGIRKEARALVSGTKLVQELCAQRPGDVEEIVLPPKAEPFDYRFKHTRLTASLFKALDVIGTKSPLAVMRAPDLDEWQDNEAPRGLELILALSDPSNLGACLRSAEAFGARRVILTRECSSPYLPKALRASSGSALRLNLAAGPALADIRCAGAFALDMDGEDLSSLKFPVNLYLILGEEGQGLPQELSARRIRIPMRPPVESLNAAVAASLALFHYSARGRAPGATIPED